MATVFKRKIYKNLLDWKNTSKGSTALLIEGARCVGKSTIVEEFARNEYKSHILIDFSKPKPGVIEIFDLIYDVDLFYSRLTSFYPVILHKRKSLIIFDEVQFCPKARAAIKHLVADGRYDFMETGCIVDTRRNVKDILIPSEEERIQMNPMDYEEFLWALGDDVTYDNIRRLYSDLAPMGDHLVKHLMEGLRTYMLVGGMPQAVAKYIETHNFQLVDRTKRNILSLYNEDFLKIDPSGNICQLFDSIPGLLASGKAHFDENRILGNRKRVRNFDLLNELVASKTVNISYEVGKPEAGLPLSKILENHKLFVCDTGLFVTLAFKNKSFSSNDLYTKLLMDKLPVNLGYVFENLTSQMLTASGHMLYYHTFYRPGSSRKATIDFILEHNGLLYPIEVKPGQSTNHSTLDAFIQMEGKMVGTGYLMGTRDIKREDKIATLPMFMAGLLP